MTGALGSDLEPVGTRVGDRGVHVLDQRRDADVRLPVVDGEVQEARAVVLVVARPDQRQMRRLAE
jgi:hypothetical protein